MSDASAPFGTRFLDELRRLGQPVGDNYAAVQRIKAMQREELLREVRKVAGHSYADVQRLKTIESPEEFAREVARARTLGSQALVIALLIAGM